MDENKELVETMEDYAEELEAIEAMGYEMRTQGFAGTQPQA